MTANGRRCCTLCESPLDLPGRPWTRDCGGDCLACMAEVGDPDAVAEMGGWQPIETAPRDGTEVLLWDRDIAGCDIGAWDVESQRWLNDCHDTNPVQQIIQLPSHWMALPAFPANAE